MHKHQSETSGKAIMDKCAHRGKQWSKDVFTTDEHQRAEQHAFLPPSLGPIPAAGYSKETITTEFEVIKH